MNTTASFVTARTRLEAKAHPDILVNMMSRLANRIDGQLEFWHFAHDNFFLVHLLAQCDAINPFYHSWFKMAHEEMINRLGISVRANTLAELKVYGITSELRLSPLPEDSTRYHCLVYKNIAVPYAGL